MTTTEELQRLRETAEKASPGPWRIYDRNWVGPAANPKNSFVAYAEAFTGGSVARENNAAHIAACSPDRILAIVREVELLRARVECSVTCEFTPGGKHTGECLLRDDRKLGEP